MASRSAVSVPSDIGADIAHGGESRQQRGGRILHAPGATFPRGAREIHAQVGGVFGPIGEMRVHVDEAGQAGVVGQIEHRHQCRGHVRGLASGLDALMRPSRMTTSASMSAGLHAVDQRPQRIAIVPLSGVNGT